MALPPSRCAWGEGPRVLRKHSFTRRVQPHTLFKHGTCNNAIGPDHCSPAKTHSPHLAMLSTLFPFNKTPNPALCAHTQPHPALLLLAVLLQKQAPTQPTPPAPPLRLHISFSSVQLGSSFNRSSLYLRYVLSRAA